MELLFVIRLCNKLGQLVPCHLSLHKAFHVIVEPCCCKPSIPSHHPQNPLQSARGVLGCQLGFNTLGCNIETRIEKLRFEHNLIELIQRHQSEIARHSLRRGNIRALISRFGP